MGVRVPRFQFVPYNSYAFLINHINLLIISKRRSATLRYNTKSFRLLMVLQKLGYINSSLIVSKNKKLIKISPFFYKKLTFFKGISLVSTPSKIFTIKVKTLKTLNTSIGSTLVILETSKGIITHKDAMRLNVGGKLLCILR